MLFFNKGCTYMRPFFLQFYWLEFNQYYYFCIWNKFSYEYLSNNFK